MDDEKLTTIVHGALVTPDLSPLRKIEKNASGKKILLGLASCVPFVGGIVSAGIDVAFSYKEYEFLRKFGAFLYDYGELSPEDRQQFGRDIEQHAKDGSGDVMLNLIDQLDNINKVGILSNLVKARVHGAISTPEFFRLSALLARIPFTDIQNLSKYISPYYSPDGETDVLLSAGAIKLSVLDEEGPSQYSLSDLGLRFLQYGMYINKTIVNTQGVQIQMDPWAEITGDDTDGTLEIKR